MTAGGRGWRRGRGLRGYLGAVALHPWPTSAPSSPSSAWSAELASIAGRSRPWWCSGIVFERMRRGAGRPRRVLVRWSTHVGAGPRARRSRDHHDGDWDCRARLESMGVVGVPGLPRRRCRGVRQPWARSVWTSEECRGRVQYVVGCGTVVASGCRRLGASRKARTARGRLVEGWSWCRACVWWRDGSTRSWLATATARACSSVSARPEGKAPPITTRAASVSHDPGKSPSRPHKLTNSELVTDRRCGRATGGMLGRRPATRARSPGQQARGGPRFTRSRHTGNAVWTTKPATNRYPPGARHLRFTPDDVECAQLAQRVEVVVLADDGKVIGNGDGCDPQVIDVGSPPGVAQPDPQFGPDLVARTSTAGAPRCRVPPCKVSSRREREMLSPAARTPACNSAMVMTLTTACPGGVHEKWCGPARRRSRRSCRGALVSESSSPQVFEIVRRALGDPAMSAASAASGALSIEQGRAPRPWAQRVGADC